MHNQKEYEDWLDSIQAGDDVYIGTRDRKRVHKWRVDTIDPDGFASINGYEFDLASGFGSPGKLLCPTEAVLSRYESQEYAGKLSRICKPWELTHLSVDVIRNIYDALMAAYDEAGYEPNSSRSSRSSHESQDRRRGSAGHR